MILRALILRKSRHYCELELTMLAKECTVLRDGFNKLPIHDGSAKHGIRLKRWDGAGSAAGAYLQAIGLPKRHYSPDIATSNISNQQLRAHHAMFGGRIELLRQGYAKDRKLWIYDIASAYPFICTQLPSMRDGTWEHGREMAIADIEQKPINILSMFCVRWAFPEASDAHSLPIPFYPFPYRTKQKGLILFPSHGKAWLMRDDLLAGVEWFKTFLPEARIEDFMQIEEYSLFYPANDEKPYEFLFELYDMRKELKNLGDILEKCIKLVINSLYGKTVQSVGEPGKAPSCACPYYGSAITAGCRAQLMRAALKDPYAIVSFMTDGISSTRPLELDGLKKNGAGDVQLGDWEFEEVKDGFYLMSGIYSYIKEVTQKDGTVKEETLNRSRGFNPHKISLGKDLMQFFLDDVLPVWEKPWSKTDGKYVEPKITYELGRYITLGNACASQSRFKLIGRWAKAPRELSLHKPGPKRELDYDAPWAYCMPDSFKLGPVKSFKMYLEDMRLWFDVDPNEAVACHKAGNALRSRFLVPTLPAKNPTPEKLSAPSIPDWIEDIEKPNTINDENPTPLCIAIQQRENDCEMSDIGAGF